LGKAGAKAGCSAGGGTDAITPSSPPAADADNTEPVAEAEEEALAASIIVDTRAAIG